MQTWFDAQFDQKILDDIYYVSLELYNGVGFNASLSVKVRI